MKHIKEFNLNEESKFTDFFMKDVPDGQKPRSVGKQLKDVFSKEKEITDAPLKYSEEFRNNLGSMESLIATALMELEDNDERIYPFTNIGFVDKDRVSYVQSVNIESNVPRRNMALTDFASSALAHRKFTDRSYNIFIRKYGEAVEQNNIEEW